MTSRVAKTAVARRKEHAARVKQLAEAQAKKPVRWFYYHAQQQAQLRAEREKKERQP